MRRSPSRLRELSRKEATLTWRGAKRGWRDSGRATKVCERKGESKNETDVGLWTKGTDDAPRKSRPEGRKIRGPAPLYPLLSASQKPLSHPRNFSRLATLSATTARLNTLLIFFPVGRFANIRRKIEFLWVAL